MYTLHIQPALGRFLILMQYLSRKKKQNYRKILQAYCLCNVHAYPAPSWGTHYNRHSRKAAPYNPVFATTEHAFLLLVCMEDSKLPWISRTNKEGWKMQVQIACIDFIFCFYFSLEWRNIYNEEILVAIHLVGFISLSQNTVKISEHKAKLFKLIL